MSTKSIVENDNISVDENNKSQIHNFQIRPTQNQKFKTNFAKEIIQETLTKYLKDKEYNQIQAEVLSKTIGSEIKNRIKESVVAGVFDGHCPKNAIEKLTVDEKLKNLSRIMNSPMELEIVYASSGLEVECRIGLHKASVCGSNESICVRQCKREILHKLSVSGMSDDTSTSFAADMHGRCRQNRHSEDQNDDDYSESELCAEHYAENTANNILDGITMVDGDMPRELVDIIVENNSPLSLKINYNFGKWENMTYQIGTYTVWANSSVKSPSMHQCKTELWQQLVRAYAKVSWVDMVEEYETNNTTNTAQNEIKDINQQCDQSTSKLPEIAEPVIADIPTAMHQTEVPAAVPETRPRNQPMRSFNIIESAEKYVIGVSESLTNATRDTFEQSAKAFYDNLVRAFHANRFHLNKITSSIVSNAIDNPDNCPTIVDICCDAIEKASVHPDATVRHGMVGAFKHGLTQSCRGVLRQAGILLQAQTTGRPFGNADRFEQMRDRTHGACRFMGQMFMKNQMFNIVNDAVHMFMQMNDVNLLECLCVLLNYIKPKLKKIIDNPRQLYEQLKRYSRTGLMDNIGLPQRTMEMLKLLLDVKECNNSTTSTPSTSFHSQRGNFETKRNNTKNNHCQYQLKSNDRRVRRTHNSGSLQNADNLSPNKPPQPLNPLLQSDDNHTALAHNLEILQNDQNPPSNTQTMLKQPLNSLLESDDNCIPRTNDPEFSRDGQGPPSTSPTVPTQPQLPMLQSDDNRTAHTHNPESLQISQNPPSCTPTMPTQPEHPLLQSDDNHTPLTHNPVILQNRENPPSNTPTMPTQLLNPLLQSGDYCTPLFHNPEMLQNGQTLLSNTRTMPAQPINPFPQSDNRHARRTHNPGVLRNGRNPPSNTPSMPSQPLNSQLHSNSHRTPLTHNPNIMRNRQIPPSYTHTMPTQPVNPLLQSDNRHPRRTHNPGVLRNGRNLPSNTPSMPPQLVNSQMHSNSHRPPPTHNPNIMRNRQIPPSYTHTMPTQPVNPRSTALGQTVMWHGQNIPHNTRVMPTQHYQGRVNNNPVVYVPRFPRHQ